MVKHILLAAMATIGLLAFAPRASAAACASGPYRAGCAGPNGAVVARKPAAYPYHPYHAPYPHYPHGTVTCARGVYRAGCAGPNGAVVRHY